MIKERLTRYEIPKPANQAVIPLGLSLPPGRHLDDRNLVSWLHKASQMIRDCVSSEFAADEPGRVGEALGILKLAQNSEKSPKLRGGDG